MKMKGFDSIGLNRALTDTGFDKTDREYVIRAVNSYDEMLSVLKEIEAHPTGSAKSGIEFKIRNIIAKQETL